MICSVESCTSPVDAKKMCTKHYTRWRRYGDVNAKFNTAHGEVQKYLMEVVIPYQGDDCLTWAHCRHRNGYPKVPYGGKMTGAHRVVCLLVHGPAPTADHQAAHSCGKGHEGCVNPRHLSWKTRAANEADKLVHGTRNRGARHGNVKLTEADVREIRALRGRQFQRDIAARFGVSRSLVGLILKGERWHWLEDAPTSLRAGLVR